MRKTALILTALLVLSIMSMLPVLPQANAAATITGPFYDQVTFKKQTDESLALGDVSSGAADLYLWRVPIALRDKARGDPNLKLVTGFGGYLSFVLNPCNTTPTFNPFSLKAVRQAVQYLIDRAYIINVIHKGDASPKIFDYGRFDADYAYVADLGEALLAKYTYNFDRANSLITAALNAAGATKGSDGLWRKGTALITINGFIRNDDPIRMTIGTLLATDLAKIGFTVNPIYGDLNKAYDIVYGSDPADGGWHFYTEGWRSGALARYDTGGIVQMYCPYYGNMPGWQTPGYWEYENTTLDDLGQKFAGGNFTSLDDRASLMRKMLQMGFDESVRLFIVDQLEPYPYNAKFQPFAYELAVGPATPYTFYTIRDPSATGPSGTGGSLTVEQKQMYQASYNPIQGFTDVYGVNEWNIVRDPGLWPDPHTGTYIPIRASYSVATVGPSGKMNVPADTETYDTLNHKWTTVGAGVQATTNVTFTYKLGDWQYWALNGQNVSITQADTRYNLYMILEWATQGIEGANDLRYDSTFAGVETAFINDFVGVKFIGNNKVTVYTNYWFPDDSYMAAFCDIFPPVPWEVYFTGERVVEDKLAAWSKSVATAEGKPWLDFVAPAAGLPEMKANLTQIAGSNLVPDGGVNATGSPLPYFDAANRTLRYDALQAWVTAKNHFLVSQGPFYFDTSDRTGISDTVKAFRDPNYPFKPGDWNYLVPVGVPAITTQAPSTVVIGKDAVIDVNVAVNGQPSSAATVIYLVLDSSANVVLSGTASPTSIIGTFEVLLNSSATSLFNPGGYTLSVISYSSSVIRPEFDSRVFTALPPYEEIIGADLASLRSDLSTVSDSVTAVSTTTSGISDRVSSLESTIALLQNILIVVVVLVIIAIIVSVLIFLRMRRTSTATK